MCGWTARNLCREPCLSYNGRWHIAKCAVVRHVPRRSGRRAPRSPPLGASTTRPGRRSWPELCAPPSAHRSLWGLSPPSCHSTGERQRPRGATGSQGTGRACSAVALQCFPFSQATFHKGTREILLNPAFSVQNSLVRASSSLLLYLAQVNPAGTEFTRLSSTVLKRKPLTSTGHAFLFLWER